MHRGEHTTFLDLDIKIEDIIYLYINFDKRDKFPLFIVRMPSLSIFHHQYSMVQYFQSSYDYLDVL